jgi:phosphoribosylaminoimidazole-succinocarboxamide synthase
MPPADAPERAFVRSGKVRDLYSLDDERLVLVASDRISAFDVVLPTPIPDKGRVLTGLSRYWFAATSRAGIVESHLLSTAVSELPPAWGPDRDELRGRTMVCRRARPLPVEIVVRGFLAGSGWRDYRRSGAVCGIPLPAGLREGERLPEPLFTPSTKAQVGHDENIGFDRVVELVGGPLAERAREIALALYRFAARRVEPAGILLADTKFELGVPAQPTGEADGRAEHERLILIDEALTPDSSRFWDAASYAPGAGQASWDKQFVRDWLEARGWDKRPPGPSLPPDVVADTRARYVEAFERITRGSFARYLEADEVTA